MVSWYPSTIIKRSQRLRIVPAFSKLQAKSRLRIHIETTTSKLSTNIKAIDVYSSRTNAYNSNPATIPPTSTITPPTLVLSAAPVNCAGPPVFVALAPAVPLAIPLANPLAIPLALPLAIPLPVPLPVPLPTAMVDILMMTGFVSFAAAAQEGTATGERVTITSAGAAEGHPGLTIIVVVAVES
jgi:hypothetical protein